MQSVSGGVWVQLASSPRLTSLTTKSLNFLPKVTDEATPLHLLMSPRSGSCLPTSVVIVIVLDFYFPGGLGRLGRQRVELDLSARVVQLH